MSGGEYKVSNRHLLSEQCNSKIDPGKPHRVAYVGAMQNLRLFSMDCCSGIKFLSLMTW